MSVFGLSSRRSSQPLLLLRPWWLWKHWMRRKWGHPAEQEDEQTAEMTSRASRSSESVESRIAGSPVEVLYE